PEAPEHLFDRPSPRSLQVEFFDLLEAPGVLGRHILHPVEPELPSALERIVTLGLQTPMLAFAHLIDRFVHILHQVERIMHDLARGARQVRQRRAHIRLPHVHGHRLDPPPVAPSSRLPKRRPGSLGSAPPPRILPSSVARSPGPRWSDSLGPDPSPFHRRTNAPSPPAPCGPSPASRLVA